MISTNRPPLVILTGPTAVGKTKLSLALAAAAGGEIVSADSMQVYRHMDIGSAKLPPAERNGIPHHLIDILEPDQEFNVVLFQRLAVEAIRGIYARGHLPVVTGGTGFYIQALLYDVDFAEGDSDPAIRRRLERTAAERGGDVLYERLRQIDPASCDNIHAHNVKRVIRAIEYYEVTGRPISEHNRLQRQNESPYRFVYFVLNDDREKLYARIDRRVDEMLADGLVDEVRRLKEMGCTEGMVSMQGLGYKEILRYLDGKCTLEQAVYLIKRDTRHFAKRQLTWFRRERNVTMIDRAAYGGDEEAMLDAMLRLLRQKGLAGGPAGEDARKETGGT